MEYEPNKWMTQKACGILIRMRNVKFACRIFYTTLAYASSAWYQDSLTVTRKMLFYRRRRKVIHNRTAAMHSIIRKRGRHYANVQRKLAKYLKSQQVKP